MTKQQQRDAAWLYWEAEADLTMTKQQLVGLVTDDTPTHLEYRDYRGYVLIDADTGEWVRDVDDEERARMELGDPIYSVEYADLRPVLS